MNARKITFRNVGIVKRSRVWLNSETGVEIIKGANFAEVGLYYVATPSQGRDNRSIFAAVKTFAEARTRATALVERFRAVIAKDHDEALADENARWNEQAGRAQTRGWMEAHGLLDVPGHELAAATIAARGADEVEAHDENMNRHIDGGPRCSRECKRAGRTVPGLTAERSGHLPTCPRKAYIHAGRYSQREWAAPLIALAYDEALVENLARFSKGGPKCSVRCEALPGSVMARGHDVDCPRRAYAAAGPFSLWRNAERLIGNAHEDALREDGERFPLHVDHGTGVKIIRTLGIHGMPVLRVMRPVRDGFKIAASRDVNDEAGAVTAAARVIAEQWEYIAGAQLAAIDEDARRTAQQLAAA